MVESQCGGTNDEGDSVAADNIDAESPVIGRARGTALEASRKPPENAAKTRFFSGGSKNHEECADIRACSMSPSSAPPQSRWISVEADALAA